LRETPQYVLQLILGAETTIAGVYLTKLNVVMVVCWCQAIIDYLVNKLNFSVNS